MKIWQIVVVVVVVVAVAVGGFFGGRATAGGGTPTVQEALKVLQSQAQQGNGAGNGFAFGGPNGAVRGGGAVSGSIIAADDTSITVKSSDGSTKIVLVSGSTTVSKFSEGTKTDLTVGQDVIVTGTANSDGSVTATRVETGVTLPAAGSGGQGSGGTGAPGAAPGAAGSTNTPPGSGN